MHSDVTSKFVHQVRTRCRRDEHTLTEGYTAEVFQRRDTTVKVWDLLATDSQDLRNPGDSLHPTWTVGCRERVSRPYL